MKVYIIVGNNGEPLKNVLEKDGIIQVVRYDRTVDEAFDYLLSHDLEFDAILLIDQGIHSSIESFGKVLNDFRELIDNVLHHVSFKFITKEPQYEAVFKQVAGNDARFEVHLIDSIKIPISMLKDICLTKPAAPEERTSTLRTQEPPKKRSWSLFGGRKQEEQQSPPPTPPPTRPVPVNEHQDQPSVLRDMTTPRFQQPVNERVISAASNLNRVVAITGDRGSGVTSTVANLAVQASSQGLTTMILDLDIVYRGMNLYFTKFGDEVDLNHDLASSLIRCMMKPDSYRSNSCRINENLSLVTLAYSVDSKDKMMEFINSKRLINLISVMKLKFNLVILDLPFQIFREYPDLMVHLDSIGLCMSNSLYSIINTVKSVEESLDKDDISVFKMKAKTVITKYNDSNRNQGEPFTPNLTLDILSSISDTFDIRMECAGVIPYYKDFDQQIDSGKKLCTVNNEYKMIYQTVLNNIL
ncbi:MAG: cobalamin biosynthesis protein CobQ [Clostridia bacterium]|nr:cobalamin biosynthesis protein CobQ [Clostridia bacterium]